MNFENTDPNRDEPRKKYVELENNRLIMEREDPYGFIKIHFERGQVPEKLQGTYTTWEAARLAIKVYLQEKGREEVKSDNQPETSKRKVI